MNRFTISLVLILLLFYPEKAHGQESPYVYGSVTAEEFESPLLSHEKGAEAIVLFDYATARIIFTRSTNEDDTGFKVEFTRHVRIRILNTTGYDFANVTLDYSRDDRLYGLKAGIYNLENGEPVGIELKRKDFTSEKANDYEYLKRFTFPQIREGSIIEYSYQLTKGNIWELMPFMMQWDIPVRHTEYWVEYPDYFTYSIKRNGANLIKESHSTVRGYVNTTQADFSRYRWIGTNLPAFQSEPYLPALQEYMAGIQFELAAVSFPGGSQTFASPTYQRFTERMLLSSYFGKSLDNSLMFMGQVNRLTQGLSDPYEKMEVLFDHVRDHVKWDGWTSMMLSNPHSKTYKDGRGNSADVNLLLLIFLRTAGIQADPVILSTRNHGLLNKLMAYEGNFNHVICLARVNGKEYLLDATDNTLPMGVLPKFCLNGEGWIASENRGRFITLLNGENDTHKSVYKLQLQPDGTLSGQASLSYDGYIGYSIRNDLKNLGIEEYKFDELIDFGMMTFSSFELEGMDSEEQPVTVNFDMQTPFGWQSIGDLAFFNPQNVYLADRENPFVKYEREFPVDIGYPRFTSFSYTIEIPEGYVPSELPAAVRVAMPENAGVFTYAATFNGNQLMINGETQINKTYYSPDEYPALREFYTQMFKKINEMVILKVNNASSQF